jgi:hypothetical protein
MIFCDLYQKCIVNNILTNTKINNNYYEVNMHPNILCLYTDVLFLLLQYSGLAKCLLAIEANGHLSQKSCEMSISSPTLDEKWLNAGNDFQESAI